MSLDSLVVGSRPGCSIQRAKNRKGRLGGKSGDRGAACRQTPEVAEGELPTAFAGVRGDDRRTDGRINLTVAAVRWRIDHGIVCLRALQEILRREPLLNSQPANSGSPPVRRNLSAIRRSLEHLMRLRALSAVPILKLATGASSGAILVAITPASPRVRSFDTGPHMRSEVILMADRHRP
ncbi:hypothetical protein [Roseateles sp.]|uniref:hypothetical protein n=1 Tax=Roseateles sp. TaxID=1971397 RepID=UPI003BA87573